MSRLGMKMHAILTGVAALSLMVVPVLAVMSIELGHDIDRHSLDGLIPRGDDYATDKVLKITGFRLSRHHD